MLSHRPFLAEELSPFMTEHRRNSKSHKIRDISYSEDWLLCVCGWKGTAYGIEPFRVHQKTAEPYIDDFETPYQGRFNRTLIPREVSELSTY